MNAGGEGRWIGLADVRARQGNPALGGACGALVAVVGDARDSAAFLRMVEAELGKLGFQLLALDDVEPLALRRDRHPLPRALEDAVHGITAQQPLALGSFHAYRR